MTGPNTNNMLNIKIMRTNSLLLALTLTLAAAAHGAVANFDGLAAEAGTGFVSSLTDGGISFSNLNGGSFDQRFFAIDNVAGLYAGAAGYSAPNILTFNAYSDGPNQAGFGRLISFDFTTGSLASSASFTVMSSSFNDPNNTFTLQGLRNGAVTGSATLTLLPVRLSVQSLTLGAGIYDSFHVVATTTTSNIVFVGVDNVVVNPIPEPASVTLVGLGVLGLLGYRMRRS